MVTILFKLSDSPPAQLELDQPQKLAELVRRCGDTGTAPDGYIAIRGGKVITPETLISDGEEITIFPAISGG